MEIIKRIEYVGQHIAAIASDIDNTHALCSGALRAIVDTASAALDSLNETRDAAVTVRRERLAAKEAARAE